MSSSGTSKEAKDFKIDTEVSGDMHTALLTLNTQFTPVRNQGCPLRFLGGCSGDT